MATTKITTPELFDFSATNTALQLPTGTTLERPTNASAGEWRFNTDEKYVEYYDGTTPYDASKWFKIDTEAPPNPDDFPSQNFNVNTYFGTGATRTIDAKFNEAANFNGSSSQIDLGNSQVFSVTQTGEISFSLWINSTDSDGGYVFAKGDDVAIKYEQNLYLNTNGTLNAAIYNSAQGLAADVTTTATVNDGNWHHVVVTIDDGSSMSIYVDNGTPVTTTSWSGTVAYESTVPFFLGAFEGIPASSSKLNGKLDQVRIFNTAITASQVNALYAETTTTAATLDFPVGAGCFAAYQLDGDASDVGGTYGGVTTNIGYTGLKFQPDLIWMKRTNTAQEHALVDSVRGIQQEINSDTTAGNLTTSNGVSSFNTNGWTMGANGLMNNANDDYVAWCWKAGGPAVTGTSTHYTNPTISANTEAGFSIVKFTIGSGTIPTTASYNHGLSTPPKLIITKPLDGYFSPSEWYTWAEPITTANYLILNTNAIPTAFSVFSSVDSTTVKYRFGSNNAGADTNVVTYNFADIAGYQRVGSYTGTGSDTGNYVYTDSNGDGTGTGAFEPAFLLVKRTDVAADWFMYDNKRMYGSEAPANPLDGELRANRDLAEDDYPGYNFYTNGFEVANNGTNMNASGGTYIYLAIAADKDTSVPTAANSFSPTLYTGTSAAQNIATPFAPDFTWIKSTTIASSHGLYDTIRGGAKWITSNGTNSNQDTPTALQKFNPNGFTLGDDSGAWGVNASGATYISWNWKAGGLPTINNDGSTTSIVSVNQAAGFSIVRYRGNSAGNQTVGHGLGTGNIPKLILFKKFTGTSDWPVYSSALTDASYNLYLNKADAQVQNNNPFNGTAPTDTVFTVEQNAGNVNDNGQDIIAYCFADVTSYQQIGSYPGNTVTNPSITTGFSPSFVVIKELNGTNPWVVIDSARAPSNPASCRLRLNAQDTQYCAATEAINRSGTGFEVASNWDGMNGNGKTYLYWAVK